MKTELREKVLATLEQTNKNQEALIALLREIDREHDDTADIRVWTDLINTAAELKIQAFRVREELQHARMKRKDESNHAY